MSEISFLGVKINFSSGEISVLGYKFRILTLVLIYILYLIMFGHLLCSCSTMSLGDIREYFQTPEKKPEPLL
jgi:hypothetical protein